MHSGYQYNVQALSWKTQFITCHSKIALIGNTKNINENVTSELNVC